MIPKNLFAIWVGDKPMPDISKECVDSWNSLMPDWNIKIIRNEDLVYNPYVKHYMDSKEFVMVSNLLRFQLLHQYGGVYVDVDIFAHKRCDELLDNEFFCGHQGGGQIFANTAVLGSVEGHPFTKELIDRVLGCLPTNPTRALDTGPRMITRMLIERGWDGKDQFRRMEDISIYPSPYFYPYFYEPTHVPEGVKEETIMTHHWTKTWM